ncbi:MAG: disulfide bond formation protein DsbD [Bacteroidetes bacterium GWF2_41_31]|nr:MAG: disulfide bond formation protein DsbD [Bacteroidetes bacterium GWF2_41_31]
MKGRLISLLLLFSLFSHLQAQILEPVKWSFSSEKVSETEYDLVFKATIDMHWHLYSQDIPMSPPATTFSFTDSRDYSLQGPVMEESKVIEEYDPNFEMVLKFFAEEAIFKQRVKIDGTGQVTVSGYLNYMCCDDTKCLPPEDVEFSFVLNPQETATVTAEKSDGADQETISASGGDLEKYKTMSLWAFFFVALGGGFIALLTPCIYPMIPLTVSYFMHGSENKSKSISKAIVYGLSIVLIYVFAGTIVAVTLGESFTNWLSTHWLPNIFFFLLFTVFAASFFGMFEIVLPSWMVNRSDKQADKGGYLGAFFMAFTLVLVSFSCTAPIAGFILALSTQGEVILPIVGMLGFSLAFAIPFTIFAIFPAALDNLPKSGGWLNAVKVVIGFIELALGLKFLSVADQTYHWEILDREVYLALWIAIFTIMGLYLLGKIKFAHDSEVKYLGVPRMILAIITFSFVVYLIPGMFGAPLKALSGWTPPMTTHDFDLNGVIRDNVKLYSVSGESNQPVEICEKPKYSESLRLPLGLEGYFDFNQALACAKEQNKPLFIDFTGHGCVNCREMESNVWSDPKVLKRLREHYIVLAMYVDDKKIVLPESEWYTSDYDGKLKKTLGAVNFDFQKTKFGVNAQPYYVLLGHNGQVLAQPRAYDLDIDAFAEFLDLGVEHFKNGKSVAQINK